MSRRPIYREGRNGVAMNGGDRRTGGEGQRGAPAPQASNGSWRFWLFSFITGEKKKGVLMQDRKETES